ncbi:MAG: hypothetical protein ABF739_12225 [Acetobacter okinawensis]|uniref:hypothetical protein n=1 Tax=Acetobacter okinawensis TaxID=1076594 RepID=UPI0039E9D79E
MKVFLSWSGIGSRSEAVATLLNEWLPCVIQALNPWISTQNIDQGSLWYDEVSSQLSETTTGILCLSKANQERPWLLFEAGALAKGLSKSRVCILLIDLESAEVAAPLSFFNHTMPNKDGLRKLVTTLNRNMPEHNLKPDVLAKSFETYWPQFEDKFTEILKRFPEVQTEETVDSDDMLKEILMTTRGLSSRIRNLEIKNRRVDHFFERKSPKNYVLDERIISMLSSGLGVEQIFNILNSESPNQSQQDQFLLMEAIENQKHNHNFPGIT